MVNMRWGSNKGKSDFINLIAPHVENLEFQDLDCIWPG